MRRQRTIPRSGSYGTFRHTATADNSSHGPDTVRERVRSYAAKSACGVEWIRLTAFSLDLQQTCAVYTVFEGVDTVQDIKLVRSGTHDVTCEGPTLSGVVFRIVEGAMRPLKGQRVGFYSASRGAWDVYATTNADGRFEFAGLSRGAGSLLAGDCSDAMDSKPIEIRGNTNVVDFDLTAFVQSCPWMFLPQ